MTQHKTHHEVLRHFNKDKIIAMVHMAKCGKLLGMRTSEMSKEEIIDHLVASKCPEIHKLLTSLGHEMRE
jgi:hypothetical protein